ncbi:TetR/AcrR family transcriptional regulator [Microbacterium hibisci]|uniref:TetR/AcrR family transcriptional regulator n=1 Tax=Microbacterium hibisci TaxID=2036000 RepID=UPI00194108D8|nr:TetR/AcrR family transcriptional regulator [Microbacterium hibisci]
MSTAGTTRKRADAIRNIESIVEAATTLLAADPDASMLAIAQGAGVGRVTLYGHFPSRPALVAEVAARAIAHTDEALSTVDTDGDPREAMERLLAATWRLTYRYGGIVVAANQALPPEAVRRAHDEPARRVRALLERGRGQRVFTSDMPVEWQLTTIQAVLHAASAAVHRREITAEEAPGLVTATVLAALTPPGRTRKAAGPGR